MYSFWRYGVYNNTFALQSLRNESRRTDNMVMYWTDDPVKDWERYLRELERKRFRMMFEDAEDEKAEQKREAEDDYWEET